MSDEEIGDIRENLSVIREDQAAIRAQMDERAKASEHSRALLLVLIGAFAAQAICTVYFAGGKVVLLDRLVEDVREIKTDLYHVKPIGK